MTQGPEPTQDELAQRALARGFITAEQLRAALAEQTRALAAGKSSPPLQDILLDKGFITRTQLTGLAEEKPRPDPAAAPSHAPLGKYEIVRELGRGGMGVVYEALDTQLRRRVALKLLLTGLSTDPREAQLDEERFLREARLSANLAKHPHLVSVYEAGVLDGKRYLAMELIDGLPMSKWRKVGSTTIRQQVKVLRDVAVAVHHAHKQNVIHRDLKPDNILIDAQGQPHVTDFGLAKSVGENVRVSLTASGIVVGTPSYMSPEQAIGEKTLDHRTDVYALGIMLYETLTGRLPFTGETAIEILMKAAKNPVPPPSSVVKPGTNPTLDKAIEAICLKALARNARDRYATAEALASDLTRWLKGEEVRVPGPVATRRKPVAVRKSPAKVWIAVAAAAAAVVLGAILLNSSPEPERAAPGPDAAELDRKREKKKRIDRLLADARSRLQEGKTAESIALYDEALRQDPGNAAALSGREEVRVREIELDLAKADGLMKEGKFREAFRAFGMVSARDPANHRASAGVEAAQQKMEEAIAKAKEDELKAKSDAERLAAEQRRKQQEEDDRKAKEQVTQAKAQIPVPAPARDMALRTLSAHTAAVWAVAFSPDGKTLASGSVDQTIRTWDVARGLPVKVIAEGSGVFGLAFAKDGRLASGNVDATVKVWDPVAGKAGLILRGHQGQVDRVAFSPDGTLAASVSRDGTVKSWDLAKGAALFTVAGVKDGTYPHPLYLSGGKVLACGSGDGMFRFFDARAGKEAKPGVGHDGLSCSALSPDGKILALAGWNHQVSLRDAATAAPIRTWEAHPGGIWSIAFSPDGRFLASAGVEETIRIWDAQTGRMVDALQGHKGAVHSVAFHPDGKLLASGGVDGTVRLWAVEGPAPEEAWKKAVDLLALVDPKRDTIRGSWRKEGGRLTVTPSENACLRLPYEAPEEYDFRMTFTRAKAGCGTAQFFVHQGRAGIWDLNKGGVGFSNVGGVGSFQNATRGLFSIQDDVRFVSMVQVRRDRVRGWIDGQRQSEWIPSMGELSQPAGWGTEQPGILGLGNCQSTTTIESLQVLEVTGKGRVRTTPVVEKPAVPVAGPGPILHWKLNEGNGAVAGDSSGNKLAGKIVGAPAWLKGKAGGLRFDGVRQRIDFPQGPLLEKLMEGSYTVTLWVKPEETGPAGDTLSIVARMPWFTLYYLPKNNFMMQHRLAGGSFGTAQAQDGSSPSGAYYHVAGVVDRLAGATRLAVNGTTVSVCTWAAGTSGGPLWVGLWGVGAVKGSDDDSKAAVKGAIDSVRLYARAIPESEIEAQYKSEVAAHEK